MSTRPVAVVSNWESLWTTAIYWLKGLEIQKNRSHWHQRCISATHLRYSSGTMAVSIHSYQRLDKLTCRGSAVVKFCLGFLVLYFYSNFRRLCSYRVTGKLTSIVCTWKLCRYNKISMSSSLGCWYVFLKWNFTNMKKAVWTVWYLPYFITWYILYSSYLFFLSSYVIICSDILHRCTWYCLIWLI